MEIIYKISRYSAAINFLILISLWSITLASEAARTFVHPGNINSKENLDFVKQKLMDHQQPWFNQYQKMLKYATPYSKTISPQDGAESEQKDDALKAYANALAWYFTNEDGYANNAVAVLNTWGTTFQGYQMPAINAGNQSQLNASWIGALLAPAAEIMRGYRGWKTEEQLRFKIMLKEKFYPILNQVSFYNGNVDLTQIDAMLNIAVFCDDEEEFNLGISRLNLRNPAYFYLSSDLPEKRNYAGSNDAKWFSPTAWPDGLTQETCRDLGHHAQYGLASALHAAEIAYNQGVDVYGANKVRYVAALEFMAKELLKGEMRFKDICPTNSKAYYDNRRDDFFDTWEIGYNHYHNRKKFDLPYTKLLLETKIRHWGKSDWNIFYETLTHSGIAK